MKQNILNAYTSLYKEYVANNPLFATAIFDKERKLMQRLYTVLLNRYGIVFPITRCGYICKYKGKTIEVYTDKGKYQAQLEAARQFKAKKSWEVDVYLAEVDGKEYIHSTASI